MLKLLWLCSWYPDRVSPDNGDFIQRHAQAASLYNHIHVIKLTPDARASGVTNEIQIDPDYPRLTEQRIYYPKKGGRLQASISYIRWWFLYLDAIKTYLRKEGKPDLVHVHIPFKAGLVALWLKTKYQLPFVITEHWGGYNDAVAGNYATRNLLFKWITRKSFGAAAGFHSVSRFLGEQVNRYVGRTAFTVIPNVVDTSLFYPTQGSTETVTGKFRLLHISNGAPVKNLSGILAAFQQLNPDLYELKVVGLHANLNQRLSLAYPAIQFLGVLSYQKVAEELNTSDLLILFSHMENAPCVIGEAFCCGKPVVATRVGGIPELADDTNSILIDPGDESALKNAIEKMRDQQTTYRPDRIANQAATRFAFEKVGSQLDHWYRQLSNLPAASESV